MSEPRRSDAQNRKWRAILSDMSRCKPEGRELTPDQWQILLYAAWDYDRRFADLQLMDGLEGRPPVPVNNYSTSILTVSDMAELITSALAYGDRHGVKWGGGDYDAAADPLVRERLIIKPPGGGTGTGVEGCPRCREPLGPGHACLPPERSIPRRSLSRDPLVRERQLRASR